MLTRHIINLSTSSLPGPLLITPHICKVIGGHSEIFKNLFSVLKKPYNDAQDITSRNRFHKISIETHPSLSMFVYGNSVTFSTEAPTIPISNQKERDSVEKWIELCRFEGEEVPKMLTDEQFDMLLTHHKTYHSKKKYLRFLFLNEKLGEQDKMKKKIRKQKVILIKQKLKDENKGHIQYGLWHNTMFSKLQDRTLIDLQNQKVARAMTYGQPLVIDCGYDNHMTFKESNSLAAQLLHVISHNRYNPEPFNIFFCNYDGDSLTNKFLKKNMPSVVSPDFPINITSQSYLDLFPKEKLIYLTPDSRKIMTHFDSDAIYIIGGLVDLGPKGPLSQAKAKMEGVNMMKLPLDKYYTFRSSKSLGIHVMAAILLELQESGDWKKALQYIPKRLVNNFGKVESSPWNEIYSKTRRK